MKSALKQKWKAEGQGFYIYTVETDEYVAGADTAEAARHIVRLHNASLKRKK